MNHETKEALAELEKTYKPTEHDIVPGLREIQKKGKDKPDSINAASYSSGAVAASFTSTAMIRETKHEAAVIEEDIGPDYVFSFSINSLRFFLMRETGVEKAEQFGKTSILKLTNLAI